MLSGVLGTPHINKAKAEKEAKAKLDKYLAKRNTQHANERQFQLGFDPSEISFYAGTAHGFHTCPQAAPIEQILTFSS